MAHVLHLHDVVALLTDLRCSHFETGQALVLRRGQLGTVVLIYDSSVAEVEFSAPDGKPYAILPVAVGQLMLLRDTPEFAAA